MVAQLRIEQINQLVLQLSAEEQETLLKMLKKQLLLAQAERLKHSVKANSINFQEIAQEVRAVRQQRYAQ